MNPKITGQTLFSWEAYEYPDRNMKTDWFWALGIIALAGSVVSFIYGNFLFGVFIIFASIAIAFFSTIKPQLVKYEITEGGFIYDKVFYPFETIHAFWMDENEPDNKKILLKSERVFVPILSIPYETEDDGDNIYDIVSGFVPEEPLQEPWGHIIMERLGF